MISLFNESINKFNDKINKCNENINEIGNISTFLEVVSIEKTDICNNSFHILNEILLYEETYMINDYSNFICPCCRNKDTLSFHKIYSRNLVFTIKDYLITAKIKLIVLDCSHCKKYKKNQHFHTLLPDFILPYHSYSSNIILDSISDKFNNEKIENITNKYKISYQLLYYWITILNKYLFVCSIILKIPIIISNIINRINENRKQFLKIFYQQYFHPFFLNRKTCIYSVITP